MRTGTKGNKKNVKVYLQIQQFNWAAGAALDISSSSAIASYLSEAKIEKHSQTAQQKWYVDRTSGTINTTAVHIFREYNMHCSGGLRETLQYPKSKTGTGCSQKLSTSGLALHSNYQAFSHSLSETRDRWKKTENKTDKWDQNRDY